MWSLFVFLLPTLVLLSSLFGETNACFDAPVTVGDPTETTPGDCQEEIFFTLAAGDTITCTLTCFAKDTNYTYEIQATIGDEAVCGRRRNLEPTETTSTAKLFNGFCKDFNPLILVADGTETNPEVGSTNFAIGYGDLQACDEIKCTCTPAPTPPAPTPAPVPAPTSGRWMFLCFNSYSGPG